MITKNEEKNLSACLDSIKDAVSEIIIVDTGSTDKTKEIAKKYTDKVFDFTWADDFSKARNFSLQKATKDWILVLDADEEMDPKDISSLKELVQKSDAIAYSFMRRNYTDDSSIDNWIPNDKIYGKAQRFSGYFPSKLVRLFKNDPRIRFEGVVHELTEPSLERIEAKTELCEVPIHHFAYTDASSLHKKREYYFQLLQRKVSEDPKSVLAHFELALTAKELGKIEQAIETLKQITKLNSSFLPAYLELGLIYRQQKDYALARHYHGLVLALNEKSSAAYFGMGMCYFYEGNLDEAQYNLEKSISLNAQNPQALTSLGAIYEKKNMLDDAEIVLKKSILLNPLNPKSPFNLGIIFERKKQYNDAIRYFEDALKLNHPKKEALKEKINELKKKAAS